MALDLQTMLMMAQMAGGAGGGGSTGTAASGLGGLGTAAGIAGKAAMGPLGWGMLAAQAIPTAINLAQAISQKKKANEFAKTQRPQYEIPQGVLDAVNQSKYLASMRELPGQNLMEGRLGQNTAKGIAEMKNVAANPADLASNVARMYGAQNDAMNNIGIQAGQNWLGQQGQLNQSLNRLGQYQQQQWDYNKNQPYQNAMAASSALNEGAFRNAMAGGTNIASGISGALNMQNQQNMMDQYMNRFGKVPPEFDNTQVDVSTESNLQTSGYAPNSINVNNIPGVQPVGYQDVKFRSSEMANIPKRPINYRLNDLQPVKPVYTPMPKKSRGSFLGGLFN
jgi:hypothetical protein